MIVETVGVGQSETAVANMTDMFCLLQLPNAGDDLQAIKKGVMELADLVVINKADIDAAAATRAEAQITSALRLLGLHGRESVHPEPDHPVRPEPGHPVRPEPGHPVRPEPDHPVRPELVEGLRQAQPERDSSSARTKRWHPQVVKISALLGQGVDAFWSFVTEFKQLQTANGKFALRREKQALAWMWERIAAGLRQSFRAQPRVRELLPQLSEQVGQGQVAASTAARQLLSAYTDRVSVRAEPVEALSSATSSPSTGSGRTGG